MPSLRVAGGIGSLQPFESAKFAALVLLEVALRMLHFLRFFLIFLCFSKDPQA